MAKERERKREKGGEDCIELCSADAQSVHSHKL